MNVNVAEPIRPIRISTVSKIDLKRRFRLKIREGVKLGRRDPRLFSLKEINPSDIVLAEEFNNFSGFEVSDDYIHLDAFVSLSLLDSERIPKSWKEVISLHGGQPYKIFFRGLEVIVRGEILFPYISFQGRWVKGVSGKEEYSRNPFAVLPLGGLQKIFG